MTHYERLGIGTDASPAEVREAFRRAVRGLHPDRHGEGTTADMASVNQAWWVLSDPARRAAYDAALRREVDARRRQEEASTIAAATVATPTPAWDPEADCESEVAGYPATGVVSRLRSLVVVWGVVATALLCLLFLYGFCRSGVPGG